MTQSNKTRTVKFLVTPDQFVRLINIMESRGFTEISSYCREMLLGRCLRESERIEAIYNKIVGGDEE